MQFGITNIYYQSMYYFVMHNIEKKTLQLHQINIFFSLPTSSSGVFKIKEKMYKIKTNDSQSIE